MKTGERVLGFKERREGVSSSSWGFGERMECGRLARQHQDPLEVSGMNLK